MVVGGGVWRGRRLGDGCIFCVSLVVVGCVCVWRGGAWAMQLLMYGHLIAPGGVCGGGGVVCGREAPGRRLYILRVFGGGGMVGVWRGGAWATLTFLGRKRATWGETRLDRERVRKTGLKRALIRILRPAWTVKG